MTINFCDVDVTNGNHDNSIGYVKASKQMSR
jgi:hypothetical protein